MDESKPLRTSLDSVRPTLLTSLLQGDQLAVHIGDMPALLIRQDIEWERLVVSCASNARAKGPLGNHGHLRHHLASGTSSCRPIVVDVSLSSRSAMACIGDGCEGSAAMGQSGLLPPCASLIRAAENDGALKAIPARSYEPRPQTADTHGVTSAGRDNRTVELYAAEQGSIARAARGSALFAALLIAAERESVRIICPQFEPLPNAHLLSAQLSRRSMVRARPVQHWRVLAAGFVGLEVAASLRKCGLEVVILASDTRPTQRILDSTLVDVLRELHASCGSGTRSGRNNRKSI
jgi:hypothetical protein